MSFLSLNSTECFLLQSGSSIFAWNGNQCTIEQQQLLAKLAEFLKMLALTSDLLLLDNFDYVFVLVNLKLYNFCYTWVLAAEAKSVNAFSETDGSQEVTEVKETGEAPASESNGDDSGPEQETMQDENDSESNYFLL
ncbi:hypothetical protein PRUPE_7G059100 [Prunus persica]|uniref:Gelsolin-like domain-containing protein n=1 Tax=Prunus persica TaxID=3760 RepID=A0A251N7E4_PRUPE|nr:hypothetical protein PRUPE_7G059100 [Prunus persica]